MPTRALVVLFVILALPAPSLSVHQPEDRKAPAPAAAHTEPPELAAAHEAFTREDWPAAVSAYKAAQARGITSPLIDFRLGYSLHMLKRYDEALACHLRAAQINHPALRIDALYNAACAYSLLNRKPEALKFLALAIDAGFADKKQLTSDTDLNPLREDPDFKDLAASIGTRPRLHQQLDFLLGTWTSKGTVGRQPETLTLARPLPASHAIVTTSTNSGGGAWTGLLVPNYSERTWSWVCADVMGTKMEFMGTAIKPSGFQFVGRQVSAVGPGVHIRLTFSPNENGAVRQTAETSDDGSAWRPHHDDVFTKN